MNLIRQNILPLLLGMAGVVLIGIGIFQFASRDRGQDVTFQPAASAGASESTSQIVVDVEGAVINPGVYKLPPESRVVDALAKAGGMSEDADRDYVQKNMNMAKMVSDGLKIYIPRVGEQVLSETSSAGSAASTININTASAAGLDSLPGVGAVTAQKIIAGRPYASTEELLSRKIVGQSVFDKIKDQISAN